MSTVGLVAFRDSNGSVPLIEWLDELPSRARDKCTVRIERLRDLGHMLDRPEAAYLRDGIYELRAKHQRVNLRMLYFFHERTAVVLTQGFTKQQAGVPQREIDLALRRKATFEGAPEDHTYGSELD